MIVGTTTFSLTPDWRAGDPVLPVLDRLAAAGSGPAHQAVVGENVVPGSHRMCPLSP